MLARLVGEEGVEVVEGEQAVVEPGLGASPVLVVPLPGFADGAFEEFTGQRLEFGFLSR